MATRDILGEGENDTEDIIILNTKKEEMRNPQRTNKSVEHKILGREMSVILKIRP